MILSMWTDLPRMLLGALAIVGVLAIIGVALKGFRTASGRRTSERKSVARSLTGMFFALAVLALAGLALLRIGPARHVWPEITRTYRVAIDRRHSPPVRGDVERTRQLAAARAQRDAVAVTLAEEEIRRVEEARLRDADQLTSSYTEAGASCDEWAFLAAPLESVAPPLPANIPELMALQNELRFQNLKTLSQADGIPRGGVVWTLLMSFAIAGFLFIGYIFLDASTRGHFTWPLRILSAFVFAAICVAMAALRHGL